jgi:hypothetical protein
MPLYLCPVSSSSSYSSHRLSSALRQWGWLLIALVLLCLPASAFAQQNAATRTQTPGRCGGVNAAEPALVRVQQYGAVPLALCEGHALGGTLTQSGQGEPLALASADFDEDGVPDLISGFASGNSGKVTIHRGNIKALWPYGAALVNGPPQPFFPNARAFAVPERPDFVVTGDFDADGHWDVITAQRGSSALYLLEGDGHGAFQAAKKINLAGNVTALIAGEMNRADGLADLVVAVTTDAGARILVYESPRGATQAQPEIFKLSQAATTLALGHFDGAGMNDLAIGAGNQLMVIHGRDRKLSAGAEERASVTPAKVTQQTLPFTVTAIVAGDFTGAGPGIAALGSDRRVHILEGPLTQRLMSDKAAGDPNYVPTMRAATSGKDGSATAGTITPGIAAKLAVMRRAGRSTNTKWIERSTVELPSGFAQRVPQLIAAHIAGSQRQDVLALDNGNNQVHVLSAPKITQRTPVTSLRSAASAMPVRTPLQLRASLQSDSAPAAVLPMRLGLHGLNGLVMLQAGKAGPVLMPQDVPAANIFTVTNTLDITAPMGDAPPGSLRDAMNQAETASGANGGSYEIDFNIPTSDPGYNSATGTFLIQPLSDNVPGSLDNFALPPINATVTIDGYTQPGASPNTLANGDNARILIRIDGGKATTPGGSGLVPFDDIGSVYRGMDFTGWTTPAISQSPSGSTASGAEGIEANGVGDFIEGNFFGTDTTGKVAAPNRIGIFADNGPLFGSAPGNIIGGTTPQARNILSSNNNSGVLFLSTALEAQLQGNFIGLDVTGVAIVSNPQEADRSNTFDGAGLNGPYVTIGGTLPGTANVIAGNGTNIDINDLTEGGAASYSLVQGNLIGTNASGTAGIANQGYGVSILHNPTYMTIGGTVPAARNIISGNLAGVYVFDNSFHNIVQGNFIGTDISGTKALPNINQGFISGATDSNEIPAGYTLIGGAVAGAGNVISGNTSDGINISGTSQQNSESPFVGNTIQGNFIGSNAGGTAAIANGGSGVSLSGSATNNMIGGTEPGSANLIAYNSGDGILIDPGASGLANTTIANVIDSNGGAGVRVASGTGNRISQNSIYENKALGIDVDATGPNTNTHCNTPNNGANDLQNYPVLTAGTGSDFISATATDPNGNTSEFSLAVAATKTGNLLTLLGNFDSTANTKFSIEFFSSPTADSSGYGQGQTYLGSAIVTTDANCSVAINNPVDLTQADVSVTLTKPPLLLIGPDMGEFPYTGTVTNNGAATAHNVVFTDTLPSQLAISSAYCDVGACQSPITTSLGVCTISGQKITCNLGTMAPGATAVISIPVQTIAPGTIANTATVSATEADPNLVNNIATTSGDATYPFPFVDHLLPTSTLVNSPDLPLTIYGEGFLTSSTVTFNGTSLPVKSFVDNQTCGTFSPQFCAAIQVVVPAALLTTTGTPSIIITNPDPGEGGGSNYPASATFTIAASCTYSPFSFLDGENIDADGSGLIAENVYVGTNAPTCPWTATSSVPWAVILDNASVIGPGSTDINVAANTGATSRSGSVTVAGQTFNFTQSGGSSCPNTLSSSSATSPAAGGTGTTQVTTGSECAYFVEPYADWITIPQTSSLLVGSTTASYVVAANHGAPRTGSVAVGATTLTISQQSPACYYTLDTSSAMIPVNGGSGSIAVTASSPSCAWTATSSNASQLSVTSGASGTGSGTVHYSLPANPAGPISPTLTIGDATGYSVFTATQASAFTCTFTITPTPRTVSSQGTSDVFTVNASFDFCKWTAVSNDPGSLTVNQIQTGSGSGAVFYSVAKNTGASRTLTITAGCQTFTINQDAPLSTNPVPTITSLLPTTVAAGAGATTLTVNGTNFLNGSVVNFNGVAKTTTFVSATQVTAALLASDVATAGTFGVTVTNPAPGGGTSNSVNFVVSAATTNNPVPTITTLAPATVTAGVGATMLTVNGTNFINGSVVNFNGAAKTTTFVSATQVTAALLASDVATAGTFGVTVTNPIPGGGTSNSANFVVTTAATTNPVPTLTTLQPTTVTAGAGATTLTVNGTNFINGSVANFNGAAKATTFVSATQVTAALLASDVATAGTFGVTVTNPTPGGGTSNSVNFVVTAAVTNNPVPTLTTLAPATVTAGTGATTLTVNGTNFINGSVVNFNGAAKTTTFVSATKVTAALLASDVATAGTFGVTVTNPTPGGGTSNSVNFVVTTAVTNNPVPTLTTLAPATVTAGAGATTLTVNGTNFINGSVINFNGAAKATTFVSATQVTAALLASDVATAGTFGVTVTNPTPGGGTSNSVNFVVTAVVTPAPEVSFNPTTLTFPSTSPTIASAAQTVTMTNTGDVTLNITVISIAGANSSAFTQTNTCSGTLAASASCTISVIFTPPSTGSFMANISVADDAGGSPQSVSLSGTGSVAPSFTVTSSATTQTVEAGGSAQYGITVSAQNGTFPGIVTLSASGLPPGATASFSQATLSPGSSSASSQLTIQTAAITASAGFSAGWWTMTAATLPFFTLFLAMRKRRNYWVKVALLVLATSGAATALIGCGGGFGMAGNSKAYTITITGTSGTEQQSTTVQLIVK